MFWAKILMLLVSLNSFKNEAPSGVSKIQSNSIPFIETRFNCFSSFSLASLKFMTSSELLNLSTGATWFSLSFRFSSLFTNLVLMIEVFVKDTAGMHFSNSFVFAQINFIDRFHLEGHKVSSIKILLKRFEIHSK